LWSDGVGRSAPSVHTTRIAHQKPGVNQLGQPGLRLRRGQAPQASSLRQRQHQPGHFNKFRPDTLHQLT
jgi:hypothetical protein